MVFLEKIEKVFTTAAAAAAAAVAAASHGLLLLLPLLLLTVYHAPIVFLCEGFIGLISGNLVLESKTAIHV